MASSSRCPPWVKDNPDQQGLVSRSQKYSKLLVDNMQKLCYHVIMVGLWVYLISLGVIDTPMKQRLQSHPTDEEQVGALLEYLLKGPCWKLHAFVRALCEDDQPGVVSQILLLNPEEYKGVQEDQDQAATSKQRKKEIKSHRDVYHRTLMNGRLFDIPSLDLPYDMEPVYIKVLATSDGLLTNPEKILPADILKAKQGKPRPRTALLSGPPGAGKSSFIRYYVYKWCQTEDGQSDWDLIIILNVSTLHLTSGLSPQEHIKEAIRQSLEGRGDKEAIMRSLDDDSLDILVIPDGMDECRSATILKMLNELISSCYHGKLGFTVLSTCRSGLSQIKDSLFDRRMKIDGFTREEGIKYVDRYYTKIQKPEDDSMYDYIASSQGELDHVLSNPLCAHIFSVVTADGTLKLRKGQRLPLKALFWAMEESMKRRQLEKNEAQGKKVSSKNELDDQRTRFYKMSLYALLKDVRIFTQSILDNFKIQDDNPYLTFMTKKKTQRFNENYHEQMGMSTEDPLFMSLYPQLKENSHWTYNHEMFHEFFSASALKTLPDDLCSAILLTLSCQNKFRNTQRLLFSVLGGDIDHLGTLSDMIRVTLTIKSHSRKLDGGLKDTIKDIKEKSKTTIVLDDLLETLIPGNEEDTTVDTSKAKELLQRVKHLYEHEAELLQTSGFLFMLQHRTNKDLLGHIYDCLSEVPAEHQQLVFDQSLGCLLPSSRVDKDGYRQILCNTGGWRWSEVGEESCGVTVHINHSLTDAVEAARQYGQHQLVTYLKDKGTRQLERICLGASFRTLLHQSHLGVWGDHPHLHSTTQWSELLSAISDWQVTVDKLMLDNRIYKEKDSCIKGFLQCLQRQETQDALRRLLVQDEGGRLRIAVNKGGHIGSFRMLAWTDWYLQQDLLQVQLIRMTSHSSCRSSAGKKRCGRLENLRHTEHNGCKLFDKLSITQHTGRMSIDVYICDTESSDGSDVTDSCAVSAISAVSAVTAVKDSSDGSDSSGEGDISDNSYSSDDSSEYGDEGDTVGNREQDSTQNTPQTSCTLPIASGLPTDARAQREPPQKKLCLPAATSSQHPHHYNIPAASGQLQLPQTQLLERQSTTTVPSRDKLPQPACYAAQLQEPPLGSSQTPIIIDSSQEGSPPLILKDSSGIIHSSPERSPPLIVIDSSTEDSS